VQRNVGGQYLGFVETPTCACQACDMICSTTCDCAMPTPKVQKIAAGEVDERTWSGIIQTSGSAGCGGFGGTDCLSPENAPYNETFNLHLCYALAAPGLLFAPDGGAVAGTLPMDAITCVDKEFHIDDGVAEISPQRGADCVTTADCTGMGELCFSGACTASCPDNSYPTIGNDWNLSVGVDDMGFFDMAAGTNMRSIYTGAGTLTSATYSGNSVSLQLLRTGASGESLRGTISFTVPPGALGPLTSGQAVAVKAIVPDMVTAFDGNVALTVRTADDAGTLLVAADSAQAGPLLSSADIAPFAVTYNHDTTGCRSTDCGKILFSSTKFTLGAHSVTLEPGAQANLVDVTGTFRALNVDSQHNDVSATCDPADIRPYLIWRDKAPGTP
jgi:hypothetical protein